MKLKKLFALSAVLLTLLSLLTVTAFADMGPKDQLVVKVINPPQEPYVLDLLTEGDPAASSTLSSDAFQAEMENLGLSDSTLYYALLSEVPSGWHACLCQHSGPPIWGKLTGSQSGDTMLHSFGYFGVPDLYRILMVTASGQVFLSESCTRTVLQSSVTVDWTTKSVSVPPVWVGYMLELLSTLVPTLLVEGLLLLLFKLYTKRNLLVFLIFNFLTQIALFLVLGTTAMEQGVSITYYLLFIPAELLILLAETIAYRFLFTDCTKKKAVIYGICANLTTAVLGWLIAEPVWRFIVSIS